MKNRLLERFLRYTRIETTSNHSAESYPSTQCQWVMLRQLVDELTAIGCSDVAIDRYGYVTATVAASIGCEHLPTVGFLAHVDTSPDMSGRDVRAQIIDNYNPDVALRLGRSDYYLSRDEFAELDFFRGHTLITTDGTTLLGADDKAGVAEIVTAAEYLIQNPAVKHPRLRLGFTPDEEVGRGVDFFDVAAFGAQEAYTVDSGMEGSLEYENFNAARATVTATGRNIHPGYAKGRMVNAMQRIIDLHNRLPLDERPESTQGREGFFHLISLDGSVESAHAQYLIRDHSASRFALRKELMQRAAQEVGAEVIIHDEYLNMLSQIEPHFHIVQRAIEAIEMAGVKPLISPIRGGTDGARLSYMGLPCPNIFTGGMNAHSRFEYVSLDSMERAVRVIVNIATTAHI